MDFLALLDRELRDRRFVAGDRYTSPTSPGSSNRFS